MGNARWDSSTYASTSIVYRSASRDQLFKQKEVKKEFKPLNIAIRESCDSEENPESTAIIIGLDVTGSMGYIAEDIVKNSLGTLVESLYDNVPVTDPHIMIMAIGDIFHDRVPLQVTQFEADIRIAEQLTDIYLESGGGGNSFESYDLPWAFAARKTKIDCFDKRGKKGYLFTMGDEYPPNKDASVQQLNEAVGLAAQAEQSSEEYLAEAQQRYNVFHLIIEQGNYASRRLTEVTTNWRNILDKRAISVNDHSYIPQIITSIIEVSEGKDPDDVIAQFQDKKVQKAVKYSLYGNK